eukprot:COSAG01_NODE_24078_length_791_cov_1.193642_1_plen_150_part_10
MLNLQFQAEADKAGLKVGTKHRVDWKGQVAQAEICRVDADGKIVGRYPDGKLYVVGDSVADAKKKVAAAVKQEWASHSADKKVYDSHWNQTGGKKSNGALAAAASDTRVPFCRPPSPITPLAREHAHSPLMYALRIGLRLPLPSKAVCRP